MSTTYCALASPSEWRPPSPSCAVLRKELGINIIGVKKAGGDDQLGNRKSFKQYGIDFVGQQRISVTKRSANIWREYTSYLHKEDRDGRILNDPEDGNDHAMDALLYGFMGLRPRVEEQEPVKYEPLNLMV